MFTMRDDYKINGHTEKLTIDVEQEVADVLTAMSAHTKFSKSEIVNTALKRFITSHKDFLPSDWSKLIQKPV